MNKRIQSNTVQVLDEVVPETWTALKYDKIKEIQYRTAELIVKECGVALSPMLRDMVSRGQAFDLIKKHFGVEE
jgi:hypothetical protein